MKLFGSIDRRIILVKGGTFRGEFLVPVDRDNKGGKDEYIFLGLTERFIHRVSKKEVEEGIKNKVLCVVEKLPRYVYNVCKQEYKLILSEQKRINNNNRR